MKFFFKILILKPLRYFFSLLIFFSMPAVGVLFFPAKEGLVGSQFIIIWKSDIEISMKPLNWHGGCFFTETERILYHEDMQGFSLTLPEMNQPSLLRTRLFDRKKSNHGEIEFCINSQKYPSALRDDVISVVVPTLPGHPQNLRIRLGGNVEESNVQIFLNGSLSPENNVMTSGPGGVFCYQYDFSRGVITLRIVGAKLKPSECFIDNKDTGINYCLNCEGIGEDAISGDFVLIAPEPLFCDSDCMEEQKEPNITKPLCVQASGVELTIGDIPCSFLGETGFNPTAESHFRLARHGGFLLKRKLQPLPLPELVTSYFFSDWLDKLGNYVDDESRFMVFIGPDLKESMPRIEEVVISGPTDDQTNGIESYTTVTDQPSGEKRVVAKVPFMDLRGGTITHRKRPSDNSRKARLVINGHVIDLVKYKAALEGCFPEIGVPLMKPEEDVIQKHFIGTGSSKKTSQLLCMVSPTGQIFEPEHSQEALEECEALYDRGYKYLRYNLIQDSYRYKLKIVPQKKKPVLLASEIDKVQGDKERQRKNLGQHLWRTLPSDAWYAISLFSQQETYIDFILRINLVVLSNLCPDYPFQVGNGRAGSIEIQELGDEEFLITTVNTYDHIVITKPDVKIPSCVKDSEYKKEPGRCLLNAKFCFETSCRVKNTGDGYCLTGYSFSLSGSCPVLGVLVPEFSTVSSQKVARRKRSSHEPLTISGPLGAMVRQTPMKSGDMMSMDLLTAEAAMKQYCDIGEKDEDHFHSEYVLLDCNPFKKGYLAHHSFTSANRLMAQVLLALHVFNTNGEITADLTATSLFSLSQPQVTPGLFCQFSACDSWAEEVISYSADDIFQVSTSAPMGKRCCQAVEYLMGRRFAHDLFMRDTFPSLMYSVVQKSFHGRDIQLKNAVSVLITCVLTDINTLKQAKDFVKKVSDVYPEKRLRKEANDILPTLQRSYKAEKALIEKYIEYALKRLFGLGGNREVSTNDAVAIIAKTMSIAICEMKHSADVMERKLATAAVELELLDRPDLTVKVAIEPEGAQERVTIKELVDKHRDLYLAAARKDEKAAPVEPATDSERRHYRSHSHDLTYQTSVSPAFLKFPSQQDDHSGAMEGGPDLLTRDLHRTKVERQRKKSSERWRDHKVFGRLVRLVSREPKTKKLTAHNKQYGSLSNLTRYKVDTVKPPANSSDFDDSTGEACILDEKRDGQGTLLRRAHKSLDYLDQQKDDEVPYYSEGDFSDTYEFSPQPGVSVIYPDSEVPGDSGVFISGGTSTSSSRASGSPTSRLHQMLGQGAAYHWKTLEPRLYLDGPVQNGEYLSTAVCHSRTVSLDGHKYYGLASNTTNQSKTSHSHSHQGSMDSGSGPCTRMMPLRSVSDSAVGVQYTNSSREGSLSPIPQTPGAVSSYGDNSETPRAWGGRVFVYPPLSLSSSEENIVYFIGRARSGQNTCEDLATVFIKIAESYTFGSIYNLARKLDFVKNADIYQEHPGISRLQLAWQLARALLCDTSKADDARTSQNLSSVGARIDSYFSEVFGDLCSDV
ncbi:hypothetical protein ACWJJH_14605 [Endozoicomonadaceae bacterium StTr2]